MALSVYFGTDQVDTHTGGGGRDWIWGGAGNDILLGGAGDDFVYGGADNDAISGNAGSDWLDGGPGDDTIYGTRMNNTRTPEDDPNVIFGGEGADKLTGGNNDDWIDGGAGNDTIRGHHGNDRIDGGTGDDTLQGRWGDDVIYGGAGNDLLHGGWGDDILTGGAGEDRFRYGKGGDSGTDIITDFKEGVDKIALPANITTGHRALILAGLDYSGPDRAHTGVTIDLGDALVDGFDGVIHILFDGTVAVFDATDFVTYLTRSRKVDRPIHLARRSRPLARSRKPTAALSRQVTTSVASPGVSAALQGPAPVANVRTATAVPCGPSVSAGRLPTPTVLTTSSPPGPKRAASTSADSAQT